MYSFIYASKNNKFSILFDTETGSLEFCYWREYAGNRFLNEGDEFEAERDGREYNGIERGLLISKNSYIDKEDNLLDISKNREKSDQIKIIDDFSGYGIQEEIEKEKGKYKALVFIGCSFEDGIILSSDFKCDVELAFLNCTFNEYLILSTFFSSNIWIVDCNIKGYLSLKGSKISGNAHLESNCFEGGVSFRGMSADNLYVDFETIGSEDIFWFNEMNVPGVVSIGGNFKSKIQILSDQNNPSKYKDNTEIGKLFIGSEYYKRGQYVDGKLHSLICDNTNATIIDKIHIGGVLVHTDITIKQEHYLSINNILIEGSRNINNIFIQDLNLEKISLLSNDCRNVSCNNLSISNDFEINSNSIDNLNLNSSNIDRHLIIRDNKIGAKASLFESSFEATYIEDNDFKPLSGINFSESYVSEATYIEDNDFKPLSSINFSKFLTNKLVFYPSSSLYLNKKDTFFKLAPPKFDLIERANGSDISKGEQYCALKHWLADGGKMHDEDIATFHMNNLFATSKISRFILGGVFGWGIRLNNIVISILFIVLIFSFIYTFQELHYYNALLTSVQSFFSILLDPIVNVWDETNTKIIWVSMLESIIGIFFITVLVGAYVRKMLR